MQRNEDTVVCGCHPDWPLASGLHPPRFPLVWLSHPTTQGCEELKEGVWWVRRRRTTIHNNNPPWLLGGRLQVLPLTVPSCETWDGCVWPLGGTGPKLSGNGPLNIPSYPSAGVSVSKGLTFSAFLTQGRGQHSSLSVSPPFPQYTLAACGIGYPAQKSHDLDLWWLVSCFWPSAAAQLVYSSHLHPPSHLVLPPDLSS